MAPQITTTGPKRDSLSVPWTPFPKLKAGRFPVRPSTPSNSPIVPPTPPNSPMHPAPSGSSPRGRRERFPIAPREPSPPPRPSFVSILTDENHIRLSANAKWADFSEIYLMKCDFDHALTLRKELWRVERMYSCDEDIRLMSLLEETIIVFDTMIVAELRVKELTSSDRLAHLQLGGRYMRAQLYEIDNDLGELEEFWKECLDLEMGLSGQ